MTAASLPSSTPPCRRACWQPSHRVCRSPAYRSPRRRQRRRGFCKRPSHLDRLLPVWCRWSDSPNARKLAMLDHHRALIYTMVIVSGAQPELRQAELCLIGDIVEDLPVFRDFDRERLAPLLDDCAELVNGEDGLEQTLQAIKTLLPVKLRETAYAIACNLVAADGEATQEELQLIELLRRRLGLDRLIAAAIERGARARFQTL